MKVNKKLIVTIGCLGLMLGASGCANKDIVKKDQTLDNKAAATLNSRDTAKNQKNDAANKPVTIAPTDTAVKSAQPAKKVPSQTQLEKIYFNFDSADLSKEARDTLARNAGVLTRTLYPEIKVRIEGNCDERGSAEYNLALGERRANAAAKYLTTLGVKQNRISTVSYGKERPAAQGNDETAWSKNRRDEFIIQ
jgi:peptidoglycan-associated lipoprotein